MGHWYFIPAKPVHRIIVSVGAQGMLLQTGYAVYCIRITAQAIPPATSIIMRPRKALISAESRLGRPVSLPLDQPVIHRQHSAQHKDAARDNEKA